MRSITFRHCGLTSIGRALAIDLLMLAALFTGAVLLGVLIHGRRIREPDSPLR